MTEDSREAGKAASTRYYKRGKARLLIAQLSDHGIRAMDDTAMPPTYHLGRPDKPLDLSESREIISGEYAAADKPSGALWTAPGRVDGDGGVKSAWTDYSAIEGYGEGEYEESLHVVRAQPGAVVVSIETSEDAEALLDHYATPDQYGERRYDWAAMKRDGIDGVYLSPGGASGTRGRGNDGLKKFYGWDASSVAWLSNEHLSADEAQRPVGKYEFERETSEDDPEGEYGFPMVKDLKIGEYSTPATPSLDGAWDRVPKKVRESKEAEAGLPSDEGASPKGQQEGTTSARKVKTPKPKEYTEAVPKDQSILDAGKDGIEFMRVALEKNEKKREDAS